MWNRSASCLAMTPHTPRCRTTRLVRKARFLCYSMWSALAPNATYQQDFDEDDIPTLTPDVQAAPVEQLQTVQQPARPQALPNPDALLHLDNELRAAAQLILQDVIADFAPHIEAEIKRRLEARLERLLAQQQK
ncbi:hypothetical protein ALP03_02166 [Pseudomonas amygdali pv. tabaci]|uniref:DNA polymerase III subunit chi n=1 Tax=Pseudomonas amygdali pv. tabaci TaxID=322 RepID=A0A3M6HNL4_PSEAJ|nr:hypothetical protein ALP03_02166 [Pseudomonas amygdali pv. tabaci]